MVNLLILSGADVKARDNSGRTPREIALKHGIQNVARILRRAEEIQTNKGNWRKIGEVLFLISVNLFYSTATWYILWCLLIYAQIAFRIETMNTWKRHIPKIKNFKTINIFHGYALLLKILFIEYSKKFHRFSYLFHS